MRAQQNKIMKRIYLLEVFFSFDGIEYEYKFSRIYSSAKEMKDKIKHWEDRYRYTISSKIEEETIYVTESDSFYKLRISMPVMNHNVFF